MTPCISCGTHLDRCFPDCPVENSLIKGIFIFTSRWRKKHGGKLVHIASVADYFKPKEITQEAKERTLNPYEKGKASAFEILKNVMDLIGDMDFSVVNAKNAMPEMSAITRKPADFNWVRKNIVEAREDAIKIVERLQEAFELVENS